MTVDKKLCMQMRELAMTTCNNSYLMSNGEILTNKQYKQLVYKYSSNQIIKI